MGGPVNVHHGLFETVEVRGELSKIFTGCGDVDEGRKVSVDIQAIAPAEVVAESLLGLTEVPKTDGVIVAVLFPVWEHRSIGNGLAFGPHNDPLSQVNELPGLQDVDFS